MDQNIPMYSSARVRGIASNGATSPTAIFAPNIGAPDITALWLTRRLRLRLATLVQRMVRPGTPYSRPDPRSGIRRSYVTLAVSAACDIWPLAPADRRDGIEPCSR